MMTLPCRFRIPAGHPCLAGHFPGNPVVPGVVLLDEVLACLGTGATLLTAKFTEPVLPGQVVEVQAAPGRAGQVAFACTVQGRPVLHGTVLHEAGLEGAGRP